MLYVVTERNISTGVRIESFKVKHHLTKSLELALKIAYECAKKYSDKHGGDVSYDKRNDDLASELIYNKFGSYYFDYDEYGWWNYSVFVTEKNVNDNEDLLFTISTGEYS